MDQGVQARARFTSQAPLFKHLLVNFTDEEKSAQSFLSRPLKLDERIVRYLLEIAAPDEALASFSSVVEPRAALREVLLPPEEKASLVRLFTAVFRAASGGRSM